MTSGDSSAMTSPKRAGVELSYSKLAETMRRLAVPADAADGAAVQKSGSALTASSTARAADAVHRLSQKAAPRRSSTASASCGRKKAIMSPIQKRSAVSARAVTNATARAASQTKYATARER